MKLAMIGNFEPAHSTENDWRRAFEALGWTVYKIQENRVTSIEALEREILASDPQLVMYVRTWGLPVELIGMWERLETLGIPSCSAHLDRYYGLASPKGATVERYNMPAVDPQFKVRWCFSADGDSDEQFARDGVNHHWLPPAVCHEEVYDAEPDPKWGGIDVAFVGARGYHPEHPRDKLVDHLAVSYGPRFARVAGDTQYGTVRGHALNRLYASIPVIAGDSCFAGGARRYVSDRFFETWGRGGFLVFPRIPWLVETFGNYPSWTPYDDFDAMTAEIDYWLDHPEVREEERLRMARLVRSEHTYLQRVQTMLDTIGIA